MTLFYISAVVLVLLGLVFALWPIIQTKLFSKRLISEFEDRQLTNASLYRDHLSELEASFAQGGIDQSQFESLKQELERNLLEDSTEGLSAEGLNDKTSDKGESHQIQSLFCRSL